MIVGLVRDNDMTSTKGRVNINMVIEGLGDFGDKAIENEQSAVGTSWGSL